MSLPNYLILGVQRGGTTSLYMTLTEHPSIKPAIQKEVSFFDWFYWLGLKWYKNYFPSCKRKSITGEATPQYLFVPFVPRRIFETLPDVKMIVLLRNPVDRAYSNWGIQYATDRPVEFLSFEEAIKAEEKRLKEILYSPNKLPEDISFSLFHKFLLSSYKRRGMYAEQLKRYYELFPKDQILIVKSEDWFNKPKQVFERIITFLELDCWIPKTFNKTVSIKSKIPLMNDETRKKLVEFFKPYNDELYRLLNRDFGWD